MKKCPSCGRVYSDMVKTCPTCGIDIEPNSQQQKRASPWYWIVYIVAFIIVSALISNLDAHGVGVIVGSIVMGAIVGLIPLLAAKSRGKAKLGKIAMVVTIVCNFLGGIILSIPSAIIFTILALKK